MKTAAEIVDIVRWLCHGATVYAVLWVGGSTWPTPVAVTAICITGGVDFVITRWLRGLANWLTSHTHV